MDIRVETIKKLSLQPGDVLHITVGGDIQVDEQQMTVMPTDDELRGCALLWDQLLPDDVHLIVSNHLVEPTIIQSQIRVGSWPPKVKKNG